MYAVQNEQTFNVNRLKIFHGNSTTRLDLLTERKIKQKKRKNTNNVEGFVFLLFPARPTGESF